MSTISKKIQIFEEIFLVFLVLFSLVLIFTNVVLRYGFSSTLTWAEELCRYIFIAATYIGAAAGVRKNGHIVVDVLVVMFPKLSRPMKIIANFLGASFACLIIYSSSKYAFFLLSVDQLSTGLGVPMWIPYLGVIGGSILLSYRFLEVLYLSLKENPSSR